jgi:hypothetical protein
VFSLRTLVLWAEGWGKDYFATAAMMRILYELCCLKDPSRSLGLGAGETIHIVPISRTVKMAQRVVFGGVAKKLNLSPWFRGRFKETQDYIEFPGKRITIVGGASSDAGALGLNVFAGLVDEGNFMGEVKQSELNVSAAGKQAYDRAQMIYDALTRRVKSRYQRSGVKGMIFLISSKRATDDFTERRIREHIKNGTTAGVFVRDYSVWSVRPEFFANQRWYKCSVSPSEGKCRVLEDKEEAPGDAIVFEFPEDFKSEFDRDPTGSTRDLAGIATDAYAPFIGKREAIEQMFDADIPHPFDQREWEMQRPLGISWSKFMTVNAANDPVPVCCPHAVRHVHMDLSRNHCATGLCIAHQAGLVEVVRVEKSTGKKYTEEAPVFHVDGVLRIVAAGAGEIDHSEVRGLVYRLTEGGMHIRSVSLDHWMSVPTMQLFKRHGYRVEEISTVKTIDPYETLRSALYEQRIASPVYEYLRDELRAIELDPKRPAWRPRIIVRQPHTKDVADALAGCIYYLAKNTKGGVMLGPSTGMSVPDKFNKVKWSKGNVVWDDEEGYGSSEGSTSKDAHEQSWFVL